MIGVGFKKLARTPVPKLPSSYPSNTELERFCMADMAAILLRYFFFFFGGGGG